MFLLLIVMSYFTSSLFQADGHLSVVCSTAASTLVVLIETEVSFSKDTVNIMPGSVEKINQTNIRQVGRALHSSTACLILQVND